MSKVISCPTAEQCETWQAPDLKSRPGHQQAAMTAKNSREHREELERLKKKAYQEGLNNGYADGLRQGQVEIDKRVGRLENILGLMAAPVKDLDQNVVDELVQLSMMVSSHMIRRELKTAPGEVVATVRDALNLLPVASGNVRLELHPEDAETIRKAFAGDEAERPWRIVEDPLLSRGGCRVLTDTSRIDATVETRLNAVIAKVMGSERKLMDSDDA